MSPITGWKTPSAAAADKSATLKVSMAFGSAPFASTCSSFFDRTWTDMTTKAGVRYIHVGRGRSHDLDTFGPDTCEIVMDNRTRYCDPTCTSNAQAGKIVPGCPVKVEVTPPGAELANVYSGYVEGWEVTYPGQRDSIVTAKCANGLKYLALSNLGGTTVAGGRTDLMVGDILTAAGWPSSSGGWSTGATAGWRALQTGLTTCVDYPSCQTPALEMIRTLADAENGAFWVNISGKARFANRHFWADTMKTAKATFGDAHLQCDYTDMSFSCDDYQLYNHIVVGTVGSKNPTTKSDATSIGKYGRRSLTRLSMPMKTTGDCNTIATWLLTRYKNPGNRLPRLECKPMASTKIWDTYDNTSGVGIGSKINFSRRPPGGGTFSTAFHVEGKDTVIDVQNNDWTLSFDLSPAALQPPV